MVLAWGPISQFALVHLHFHPLLKLIAILNKSGLYGFIPYLFSAHYFHWLLLILVASWEDFTSKIDHFSTDLMISHLIIRNRSIGAAFVEFFLSCRNLLLVIQESNQLYVHDLLVLLVSDVMLTLLPAVTLLQGLIQEYTVSWWTTYLILMTEQGIDGVLI